MGKAGENRIFNIDFNAAPFLRLFNGKEKIYIEDNGYTDTAEWLEEFASVNGYNITWIKEPQENIPVISICENIFKLDDLSRNKIYVDINKCVFETEDDAMDIINYNYSKKSFIFAQKPVFLECAKKLREKCQTT